MNTLSLDNPMPKTSLRQLSNTGPVSLFPLVHRKKMERKQKKKQRKTERQGGIHAQTVLKKKDIQIMP